MSDFINTIDNLGEAIFLDRFYRGTLVEYQDDKITHVGAMVFDGCEQLAKVNIPCVKTLDTSAFNGCSALVDFNAPLLTAIHSRALAGTAIKELCLEDLHYIGMYAFQGCTALKKVDISSSVDHINIGAFYDCTSLDTLILRNCLNRSQASTSNLLTGTPIALGKGYIYVPSSLLSGYKTATGWSTYSAQFRAIEDYPDICSAQYDPTTHNRMAGQPHRHGGNAHSGGSWLPRSKPHHAATVAISATVRGGQAGSDGGSALLSLA